jgi:hypothetical protein
MVGWRWRRVPTHLSATQPRGYEARDTKFSLAGAIRVREQPHLTGGTRNLRAEGGFLEADAEERSRLRHNISLAVIYLDHVKTLCGVLLHMRVTGTAFPIDIVQALVCQSVCYSLSLA